MNPGAANEITSYEPSRLAMLLQHLKESTHPSYGMHTNNMTEIQNSFIMPARKKDAVVEVVRAVLIFCESRYWLNRELTSTMPVKAILVLKAQVGFKREEAKKGVYVAQWRSEVDGTVDVCVPDRSSCPPHVPMPERGCCMPPRAKGARPGRARWSRTVAGRGVDHRRERSGVHQVEPQGRFCAPSARDAQLRGSGNRAADPAARPGEEARPPQWLGSSSQLDRVCRVAHSQQVQEVRGAGAQPAHVQVRGCRWRAPVLSVAVCGALRGVGRWLTTYRRMCWVEQDAMGRGLS